jgi:ligand-binding sensor domain-containing protein
MKPIFTALISFLLATYFSVAQTVIDISEYNVEQGLSQSLVTYIEQDSRGFLWVGTGEGLNRFDGFEFKQFFKEVDNPHSINNNSIRGLAADKKRGVWVGTDIGLNYSMPIQLPSKDMTWQNNWIYWSIRQQ